MNTIDHDASSHRFSTHVDGCEAVLDYTLSDGVMCITHTGVPPAISGRGIAAELMRSALKTAHACSWRVTPACSYAAAYIRRHPEGDEHQHEDELLDEALKESFPASDPPAVGGSN